MTKCLAGIRSEFYPSEETFAMAKVKILTPTWRCSLIINQHHLKSMGYVGLTERFDESLKLMKYYFGFTDLSYVPNIINTIHK